MRTPYATYAILITNILVFIALAISLQSLTMNTGRDVLAIIHWGANVNPLTLGGEPWRIFTSMFLHLGIWHLAINMLGLYSLGTDLEYGVGSWRFTLIYFICGVSGNLLNLLISFYSNSAGASGAIFGLCGYQLAAFLISNYGDPAARRRVLMSFVFFVILSGVITLFVSVDLWGHIGGFIAGAILAVAQLRFRVLVANRQLGTALLLLVATMFLLPKDQVKYYHMYQGVLQQERITNGYYQHELDDAELADSLRAAIQAWDSISLAFDAIGPVRSPLHHDTSALRQYIRQHRSVTNYRTLLISRQSYTYLDSIEIANSGFDSIPALDYQLDYYPRPAYSQPAKDTTEGPELTPRRIFYDASWREIHDPSAASYYRLGQVDSAGRWQGAVRDYYRNGDIQMKGTYTDNLKDGVFLYYSDHHTYTSAGRYQREEAIGKWESFHWNGRLQTETLHNSKTFVASVYDSLGIQQVAEGNGTVTAWHNNGQIAETGQYFHGMRTGDWLGYHADGKPYYREQYRDNRLVQGAAVDAAGKRYVYDELSQYAYPVNGMNAFDQYVEKNIRRPYPKASGARIRLLFQVGKEGDLWDFVILEGYTPEYEQEAIRLVKEGPKWRQGLLHGHIPVPSQGYAVILF